MTAERKASIKGTVTLAFSGASLLSLLWIGATMARIDRTLTYAVVVQDVSDWQYALDKANDGATLKVPDFWPIWARNHEHRKSVIGGMP